MKPLPPLRIGQRVRTIGPIALLPIGAQGIVRAIFPLGDFYDILFTEGIGLRIVRRDKLESVPAAQDIATANSA